jgi:hypothetical protein
MANQVLASTGSLEQVALALYATSDYQQAKVNQIYQQYLDRTADSEGLPVWSGALSSGLTDEQVIAMILSDHQNEFYNKTIK